MSHYQDQLTAVVDFIKLFRKKIRSRTMSQIDKWAKDKSPKDKWAKDMQELITEVYIEWLRHESEKALQQTNPSDKPRIDI